MLGPLMFQFEYLNKQKMASHVCSSLVYDSFRYAGVDLLPGQPDVLVTPDDLASGLLLEKVEVPHG